MNYEYLQVIQVIETGNLFIISYPEPGPLGYGYSYCHDSYHFEFFEGTIFQQSLEWWYEAMSRFNELELKSIYEFRLCL